MSGQQILRTIKPQITKKNGFLMLSLGALVLAEGFVERDFLCPCERKFRAVLFAFYLVIPTFIVFTVTFCIMCELKKQKNEAQGPESDQETQTPGRPSGFFILRCCIPSIFWAVLFFTDGRYLSCLVTVLKGEYADSTPQPPWEWCDRNRTLTADQKYAEQTFTYSKGVGFGILFVMSVAVLVYKCRREYGASSQQRGEPQESIRLSQAART